MIFCSESLSLKICLFVTMWKDIFYIDQVHAYLYWVFLCRIKYVNTISSKKIKNIGYFVNIFSVKIDKIGMKLINFYIFVIFERNLHMDLFNVHL